MAGIMAGTIHTTIGTDLTDMVGIGRGVVIGDGTPRSIGDGAIRMDIRHTTTHIITTITTIRHITTTHLSTVVWAIRDIITIAQVRL